MKIKILNFWSSVVAVVEEKVEEEQVLFTSIIHMQFHQHQALMQ
jgi:hypothetical protein